MKYSLVRLGAAVLVGSFIVACPTISMAGWGHLHGGGSSGGSSGAYAVGYSSSGGSSGAYGVGYGSSGVASAYASSGGSSGYSAYGSYYASSGGSSGGVGPLRRLAIGIHSHLAAKHARHAARRASYGSSGVYASSGGSSGSYSASYSSSGGGSSGSYSSYSYSGGSSGSVYSSGVSYGSTGKTSYGSTGGVYYGASNSSSSAASVVTNVSGDSVYLTVAVPSDAAIYVNGNRTTSTGAVREFVSRGLLPGKSYKFDVRAELQGVDGQLMVESKTLVVTAGEREQVQFAFAEQASPIETAVTLNVPKDAQVVLSGNGTQATGATRVFRTNQLKPGETWDDYEIEVRVGEQVKRQSIRLIAGDKLQLTFAFDDEAPSKLASR